MALPEELQAAEADAERRRQEELYALLTQPAYEAPLPAGFDTPMSGFLDVGTDEPQFVTGTGYQPGGREGFVERIDFDPNPPLFGWAPHPLSFYQQADVAPDVLSDENIAQYARAYQYLRENPETVYDPNSEFRRQLAIASDLVNRFNVAIPNKDSSFAQGLLRTGGGMLRNLATNPVVMAALTGGLATPATAGAAPLLTPIQAAATTGAISGAASSENPFTGALRGGAIGGLTAGAGQYAGETVGGMFPDNPWLGGLARGTAAGVTGAALTGGDIFQSGAVGGITGALSGIGQGTPSLSDQEFDALIADTGLDALPETPIVPMGPTYTPALMTPPEQFLTGELAPMQAAPLTPIAPALEADPLATLLATQPQISDEDFEAAATEDALTGEAPPVEETPKETKLKDLVKAAKKIHDLMRQMGFGQDVPEFTLPPQGEDESEEAYLARISDLALGYLGLDPNAMRAAGYEPGTPEYLDYVLAQADKVIAAAYGDADPAELEGKSIEALQQEFRGKSEQEMEALARALYVRGALGTKSFREFQIDPFTGQLEYLGAGGGAFGPTAGAQRGYARFLEQVAGQSAPEARRSIQGLLGRDIDIFGLEQARQDRTLQDMLAQFNAFQPDDEEDLYERRGVRRSGLLPNVPQFWQQFRR